MHIDLSIDPEKTTKKIKRFIKDTVSRAGFKNVVIGLSGGVDSAICCVLAVEALGEKKVFVGLFPYGNLSQTGVDDAQLVIARLGISKKNITTIDIKPLVDTFIVSDSQMNQLRKGNIMARVRMILLYDLAKKYKALVLGTENRTEYLLSYFTRYGDEASDIEPIRQLYKTQVRQLARYLKIPDKIVNKAPTAGLWPGQTDEGEFGFSYIEADQILHLYVDLKRKEKGIIKAGFSKRVVDRVLGRMKANDFKHKLPYVTK